MKKNENNAQMILNKLGRALESGELSEKEVEKVLKQKSIGYRKKAYSEENVKAIAKMIRAGATSKMIREIYNICKSTVRNYLFDFYSENYAKKLMKKLNENDRAAAEAEAMSNVDATVNAETTSNDDATVNAETTSADTDVLAETTNTDIAETITETPQAPVKYLIDSQMVQRFDGRIHLYEMLDILKSEKSEFAFYSLPLFKTMAENVSHKGQSYKAKIILEKYHVCDTDVEFIQDYAKANGYTVITPSTITKKFCDRSNVPVILIQDFLNKFMGENASENAKAERTADTTNSVSTANTESTATTSNSVSTANTVNTPNSVSTASTEKIVKSTETKFEKAAVSTEAELFDEFTIEKKTFSLPVTFNNVKRIIANVDELTSFAEKTYSLTHVRTSIFAENGKQKISPYNKLRLVKGDLVEFIGESYTNTTITVYLRVISETLKDNCYECRYTPSDKSIILTSFGT